MSPTGSAARRGRIARSAVAIAAIVGLATVLACGEGTVQRARSDGGSGGALRPGEPVGLRAGGPLGRSWAIADPAEPCVGAPDVRSCADVAGPGGRFLLVVAEAGDGSDGRVGVRVLEQRRGRAVPVLASEPVLVRGAEGDGPAEAYAEVTVGQATVGERQVGVVTFVPPSATAPSPVHEIVTWDGDDARPRMAVRIVGGRGAALDVMGDAVRVVESDFGDGSPGCCPKRQAVRVFRPDAGGRWSESRTLRPFEDVDLPVGLTAGETASLVLDAWLRHDRFAAQRHATPDAVVELFERRFPGVSGEPSCSDETATTTTCAWPTGSGAVVLLLEDVGGEPTVVGLELTAD